MTFDRFAAPWALGLTLIAVASGAHAQSFTQGFDGNTLPSNWVLKNLSTLSNFGNTWAVVPAITDSTQTVVLVSPHGGSSFAAANSSSVGVTGGSNGIGTINNWFISPVINGLNNGDTFSFYTTTVAGSTYPDRLELRLSTIDSVDVGASTTSVGDFTTLLLSVNPNLSGSVYPSTWTLETATVVGLSAPVTAGRVALRYFVTQGGPNGANSNVIAVDDFSYTSVGPVPEPGTWALFGAGLVGVAALRRRRTSV